MFWKNISQKAVEGIEEALSTDEKVGFWSKMIGIGSGALLLLGTLLFGGKHQPEPTQIIINNYIRKEDMQ